ncbi:unnamed protein product [Rotaria sordida]|uniref:Sodium-dependent multivitamin transporter n=1 Tax=Rotaria sordida TaxID=392033 RepID=A0A815JU82_9BILA|nr:unnamed protein product [Rotaria sordida]
MYLGWIDYGVLALLLSFSAIIGIYQGCIRSKQLSTKEFLIADGQMSILPTAMSLLASTRSASTLLGSPVEVYQYGTTYLATKLFIPKFHQIGSVSIYAYLEQRFSLTVRIVVTCTFLFTTILYMAVILYAPSLALSQVTGLNIWLAVGSCGLVCTIYTSIGGMKAVIWTDVIQTIILFLGIVVSIIFGFVNMGGITKIFETLTAGNRLQFSVMTLDPSVRYTFWSILFGKTFFDTALCACLQTHAQRYMCVKDIKAAQRAAWIYYVMTVMIIILCTCVGCLLYAKYSQCDPLRAKLISKPDQVG